LSHIARSILTHHERWDGKGYPLGLKGEDTPLVARIISVVDAYDAMTHNKVYKKAMTKEEAISEIRRCANTQFDPIIAEVFCNMMEKEN
ncbi:MAG: HD-GYP domain-containing protein, partial [Paraclostridium sp.]